MRVLMLLLCLLALHGQLSAATFLPAEGGKLDPSVEDLLKSLPVEQKTVVFDDMIFSIEDLLKSGFDGTPWTDGVISYEYAPGTTAYHQQQWLAATRIWSEHADLHFVRREGKDNYLIVTDADFNRSWVGMRGGSQEIWIYNWNSPYIIAHEIGHALGLWHEQQRPDRTTYVDVHMENVQDEYGAVNYGIYPSTVTYGPYDFDSLMHYGQCAFSIDCPPGTSCNCTNVTMTALPPNEHWQDLMGQRDHLSTLDIQGMIARYGPAAITLDTPLTVTPLRVDPYHVHALPDEYGLNGPDVNETTFNVSFTLRNVGADIFAVEDYGTEVLKDGVHQFYMRQGYGYDIPSGETLSFSMDGWLTDAHLDGGAPTAFDVLVQYKVSGIWLDAQGADSQEELHGYPRPALDNGMLIKRPRTQGDMDAEVAKIYYHQWGRKWWIVSEVEADNLFPGWDQLFYVYPAATVDALSDPAAPTHDATVPVIVGQNMLFKLVGDNTKYIVEPESGTPSPLVSRPFSDDSAFWSYGYSSSGSPNDLVAQVLDFSDGSSWLLTQFPLGTTIDAPESPPEALFTSDLTSGQAPLLVQFSDLSTGNPDSWYWDFGDGTTSSVQHPSHTYTVPNSYDVSLLVSNAVQADYLLMPAYITVGDPIGDIWTVNPDGSGDFPTIQAALNAAQGGDVVMLGSGVFSGTGNRDLNFQGKPLTLRSVSGNPENCTIDVGGSAVSPAQGIIFGELEPQGTRVERIRFMNGYHSQGGAIAVYGSQVTLTGCVFEDNTASSIGGAIYLTDYNESIIGCEFRNNHAVEGGAIYLGSGNCTIDSNLFEGNVADFGGAIRVGGTPVTLAVSDNTFQSNSAATNGSAIMTRRDNISFVDNLFVDNQSGGVDISVLFIEPWTQTNTVPIISDNTFMRNEGTAISSTYELNMLIERNVFAYSTFFGMYCSDGGTGEHAQLSCNVFYGNGSGDTWCGDDLGGNIITDPLLCDPHGAERTVVNTSPCLPANNTCGILIGGVTAACDYVADAVDTGDTPATESLLRAYPNPFNPQTTISFDLPSEMAVDLRIYDVSGRLVDVLVDGEMAQQGRNEVVWRGGDQRGRELPSGTYFYRLEAGGYSETKRMTLLK